MKSLSAYIIFVLVMLIGCRTTPPLVQQRDQSHQPSDAKKMNLQGPVKSVEAKTYKAKKNTSTNISKSRFIGKWITTFNQDGNKRTEIFYNPDGTKNLDYNYRYNKAGKLIDEEKMQVGKSYHQYFTYSYDNHGRLKFKRLLSPDTTRTVYSYEDDSHRVIQKSYDTDEKFYSKAVEKFKTGHLTEAKFYSFISNNLDQKDELILNNHAAYQYNKKGNRVEDRSFNPDGTVHGVLTYHYDKHGNVIRKKYQSKGEDYTQKYSYRYRYSARQNWVRKVTSVNGSPDTITEREITYFE